MRSPTRNAARPSSWLVAAALVVAVACSGDRSSPAANPTVPTAPPTTDPFAVPAVIDEAYVNRVLAALDEALGDVTRLVVRTRSVPPEAVERLRAIYADDGFLQLNIDSYRSDIARGFAGYRQVPGDGQTRVTHLISASKSCVFAQVSRDYSKVSDDPTPRIATEWVSLVPTRSPPTKAFNPTSWAFKYDGFEKDMRAPANPCPGS